MNAYLLAEQARAKQRRERDEISDALERMADPNGEARMIVHLKRPDGRRVAVKIDPEYQQRVMDLASGECGDPSVELGEPPIEPPQRGPTPRKR